MKVNLYHKPKSREFVDSWECVSIIGHIPQIANHRADLFHILLHLVFSCVICNLGHKGSAWNVHTRLGRVATSWTLNCNYNSISSITILILIVLMYYSIELIFKIWKIKFVILLPCLSMWPKQFWSVQNGFGLTKLI